MINKTKNQTVLEYFDSLQKEYILCELKKKISTKKKDKEYFQKTMDFKKEKILDISQRNNLQCVFTNSSIKNDYIKKVYYDFNFLLINFEWKDLLNYFSINSDVVVSIDTSQLYGKILCYDVSKGIVKVLLREKTEIKEFTQDLVKRIL